MYIYTLHFVHMHYMNAKHPFHVYVHMYIYICIYIYIHSHAGVDGMSH